MITEPEMTGGTDGAHGVSESDEPLVGAVSGAAGAERRGRWLWVAGAVVVTSAVWAAVLHGTGDGPPDLHGYHLSGNPCADGTFDALRASVGARYFAASDATVSRGPALDRLSCVLSATAPAGGGWVTDYTVAVSVELHHSTDPRAEFENAGRVKVSSVPGGSQDGGVMLATTESGFAPADQVHPVSGIGDAAYLLEPRPSAQTLNVLHGGAVLALQLGGTRRWEGPGASPAGSDDPAQGPDLTSLRPQLTAAMRHLMTKLAS